MAPSNSGLMIRPMAGFAQALQQLYEAPPDTIRGIDVAAWGSPGQPIRPMAPEGTEPRGWQWWFGQNMMFTPRADAEYSAADLKYLASYPLARICIENVKDQICRAKRVITLKPKPGETKKENKDRAKDDTQLRKLNDFWDYPDGEHNWSEWVRPLLEDMLVIDAPATLIRKTFKQEIAELRVIRGESIVRLIDGNGYTPKPPSPAYQQNWWGLPLVDLTTEQLVYKPRNIVPRNTMTSQIYGMSPTEQIAEEIKVGIERLKFVLAYYTEGSIPGVVHVVPKGTPPDKISEAMLWMNSDLAGNLAARRQWRMIPGFNADGKPDQIIPMKEPLLSDAFDEIHIRKICFAYGTSPQRLMRMMGTRNADAQQEASIEEGLLPWLDWLKGYIDYIIQKLMGLSDYEITFDPLRESDPVKQAEAAKIYVGNAIRTPNQVRDYLGDDPDPSAEANMLGVITGSGFVPITGQGALTTPAPTPAAAPTKEDANGNSASNKPNGATAPKPNGTGATTSGAGAEGSKPNGNGRSTKKAHCGVHDAYDDSCIDCSEREIRRVIGQTRARPKVNAVGKRTKKEVTPDGAVGFIAPSVHAVAPTSMLTGTIDYVRSKPVVYKVHTKKLKLSGWELEPMAQDAHIRMSHLMKDTFLKMKTKLVAYLGKRKVAKAADDEEIDAEELADELFSLLQKDFASLPSDVRPLLDQGARAGIRRGMIDIQITDSDIIGGISVAARDYAVDRAAELVGMKYDGDGNLIENPDARWAITDTTRDDLRSIITSAFEDETSLPDIAQQIAEAGVFSDARAEMIARTEVGRAQSMGNLEVWKQSGAVENIEWVLAGDHDQDDECDDNASNGPYAIDEVPDFPAHPNCQCLLVVGDMVDEG